MMRWLVSIAFLAAPLVALAQGASDIAQERRAYLRELLTDPPALVAGLRKGCVRGIAPEVHRESLRLGRAWSPDATDSCVTVLTRHGRDGTLDTLYRTILQERVGNETGADTLASEMGAHLMRFARADMPLARGAAVTITGALAFDAGFTNGYRSHERESAGKTLPDETALKPIAERCLALAEPDLQLCYSTAYVYGLRAAQGWLVSTAR